MTELKMIKVAILDLNNGVENQGIRCIKGILESFNESYLGVEVEYDLFDVRQHAQVPGLGYDVYISSGGPGSPYDGVGTDWERLYFDWMDLIWAHNQTEFPKKFVLMICHSFQMMCRHFDLAEVVKRKSDSFGIMPVHLTEKGKEDPLFSSLADPFYGADFREWQVLQPKTTNIKALGASILAIEKDRPHVPLERAVMALRISDEIVGTQFHPEADPEGMLYHFSKDQLREKIQERHGTEKFDQVIERLKDPTYLMATYLNFIPSFLKQAIHARLLQDA